ncbi:hypothetical protein CCACVL1_10434 [Corchorus capsularis]|uniref:HMG box domain-containing protein n=1 Tax=Corchorus capsularis TaxID=210143 RepID=A0A1R3IR69_COCAP|nr:hypothetical protein CCACVL1_10434 [Corchorus capsularis]
MKGAGGKGAARNSVEALRPVDDRKVGKRKATKKDRKAMKDPNKPKRPPSAFFVFLEEFRAVFKKENPNVKAVSAVGKAAGEKWKSMSPADKEPYEAKAKKLKANYEKQMDIYNGKGSAANGEESKSEVHDEEEEGSAEENQQEQDEEEEEDDDEDED